MFLPVNLQQWVSVIQGIVTTGAVTATAVAAVWGLNTWRRQMVGSAELEVSRQLLRSLYRVRDQISFLRSDKILPGEQEAAQQRATQSKGQLTPHVAFLQSRYERLVAVFPDYNTACLEAEVLWGDPMLKHLQK